MGRWSIRDGIKDDMDALNRIRAELRALNGTKLTDEQLARLFRIALETNRLIGRAREREHAATTK
jgi:hypothetical protein